MKLNKFHIQIKSKKTFSLSAMVAAALSGGRRQKTGTNNTGTFKCITALTKQNQ